MKYVAQESFDFSQNVNSDERVIPKQNSDRAKVLLPLLNGNRMTKQELIEASTCLGPQGRISELKNHLNWPIAKDSIPFKREDGKEVTISRYYIPRPILLGLLLDDDVKLFIDNGRQNQKKKED